MTSETNIYAERAVHTAELRGHFVRHIDHMTRESLHYKSDIAAELAFRDAEIDRLRNQVNTLTDALAGMIGASTKEELDAMEIGVRSLPGCEEDRAVALNAIHALRACAV